jgi:catechol 2,3-dioxygenase-like lactoylglutathione lyase family enzyme
MQLMYAIDGVSAISQAALNAAGLGYLKPCGQYLQIASQIGPGNNRCTLFWADQDNAADLRYDPQRQIWNTSLNGKFHVGFYVDNPPTEMELRRNALIDGHGVELLEGQAFTIPVARCFPAGTKLPQTIRLTSTGTLETSALAKYQEFCTQAERLWAVFAGQVGLQDAPDYHFTEGDQWTLAISALRFNYLLSDDEVNLLGLITTETFTAVALAVVDEPTFRTLLEKLKIPIDEKKNNTEYDAADPKDLNSGGEDS